MKTVCRLLAFAFAVALIAAPVACLFAAPPLDVLNPEFPAAPEEAKSEEPRAEKDEAAPGSFSALGSTLYAGAPGATAEPSVADRLWPEGIDWVATSKWVSGIAATVFSGWYAIERIDYHEDDPEPAPVVTPAAIAGAPLPPEGQAEAVNLLILGSFVGPVQSAECGAWTPGLTFAQAAPGRSGEISAFLSSACDHRQGGGTWRATYGGEIAINLPDGAYAGLATIQGASIVLSSGVVLRPQAGASITVSRP